jgi:uncharacterized protein YjbJ (UPF0337 family)
MAKSARRHKTEGTLDKIGGSILRMWGKVTGKPTKRAKGRAARGRGHARSAKGRVKRAAR